MVAGQETPRFGEKSFLGELDTKDRNGNVYLREQQECSKDSCPPPLGPPARSGGQCRSPGETRACRACLLEAPWWVCKAPKEGWCHWPPREPGTQALGPLPQQSSQAWCTAPTRSATTIPLSGVARTVVNGTLKTLPFQMLTSKKSGERSHRSGDGKRLAACPVGWR